MRISRSIYDLVHFVGGAVVFVDIYDGVTSYHCEQREGVRDSELPFDFQVRVAGEKENPKDFQDATLLFAGRDGKTVEIALKWVADVHHQGEIGSSGVK